MRAHPRFSFAVHPLLAALGLLQMAGASAETLSPNPSLINNAAQSAPLEQVAPVSEALTLMQAFELALVHDLKFAAAQAAFRAVQEQVPQVRAGLRPQVSLAGSMGASDSRPSTSTRSQELIENHQSVLTDTQSVTQGQTNTSTRQDGNPSADSNTRTSTTSTTESSLTEQTTEHLATQSWQNASRTTRGLAANAELSMRWPLYRPSIDRQLELSQINESQAQVRLQAARQDVAVRLSKAYFDVILSQESLRAIETEKAAIAVQFKVAEQSFKEGETTIADVKEAQAKWDIVRAQDVAQRNALQVRLTTLQALIGKRTQAVQTLKVDELLNVPPELGQMADWVQRAETQSFPVLVESLGLAAAEKEVAKQGSAYKPSLDFVASLGAGRSLQRTRSESASATSENASLDEPYQSTADTRTSTTSERNGTSASGSSQTHSTADVQSSSGRVTQSSSERPASNSRNSSTQYDAYVGIRLNIPLYDGGLTSSRVREALALQDQKALDLQRVKAEAALAAETAYLEAQGFFAEASALKAAELSGQVALKSNQMGYQAGVRINSDILNAQQQLFTVRRDLIKAQVSALLSTLQLKASAGALSDRDVLDLGQWLQ